MRRDQKGSRADKQQMESLIQLSYEFGVKVLHDHILYMCRPKYAPVTMRRINFPLLHT